MSGTSPFQLTYQGRRSWIIKILEHITGLSHLDKLYRKHIHNEKNGRFVVKALEVLGIHSRQAGESISTRKGEPLVVVANHPFGGAEGLILMDALLQCRPDVKVLSNEFLNRLPELKDLFIGVDIFSDSSYSVTREQRIAANQRSVEEAASWVQAGGALIIFPAGQVAAWNWQSKTIEEAPWRHAASRIIQTSKAAVLPIYFEGRNSWFFHGLGTVHPVLRTLWLVRELTNKKSKPISWRAGAIEPYHYFKSLDSEVMLTKTLRTKTFLLKEGLVADSDSSESFPSEEQESITAPLNTRLLQQDIDSLPLSSLLLSKSDYEVWCCKSDEIPYVLQEIGRLREVTFRQVGEGTGRSSDLDEFDSYYLHIFVWNRKEQGVVGAYRLGQVDCILRDIGVQGLYSRSLFQFDECFLEKLGPAVEMGRSFVRPEYQKSLMALQLLWKGIGQWISRNPQYSTLFGPVSISSDYQELSRRLMVMAFESNKTDSELAALVKPLTPFTVHQESALCREMLAGITDMQELSGQVRALEQGNDIPVLLKQYLKLNGLFVGFNLDAQFSDALDGLIVVDLLKSDRKSVVRYLGEEGYQRILDADASSRSVDVASHVD
ncbi:lysophospholipid acyltransferase family protein [Parendozoicomonas haliclonae]|uniref:L-ornithine N(alpha)-acyltransferase n=1 Tax=Parendozoicomonas haliclonae TaxID=1960125 RepID=A0A1X7AQ44_9GAMM|nr:GNAT family N-acyltransferase [Parendozoicomonas haliclonae]SMA50263.1 hypothetical protein EHSB41UT_04057 [Parendozoicomonas haliclonae]